MIPNNTTTDRDRTVAVFVATWNVVLASLTVPGNGFLLLALYRDPLRCFRTPTTLLVKSMTFANLLTGFVVEPLTAASEFASLYGVHFPSAVEEMTNFIRSIAPNASFMTVYALSLDSYIAVSRPMKYKVIVTKRNVIISMVLIWGYITCFALLLYAGLNYDTHIQIDLYVNTTLTLLLLFTAYIGLIKSLSANRTRAMSLHTSHREFQVSTSKNPSLERSRKTLQAVIILVIILTVTIVPNMISWMLYFNCSSCRSKPGFYMAKAVLRYLGYLKFLLDPFVYAWRLPRYRRSLKLTVTCRKSSSVGLEENTRNSVPFCETESNVFAANPIPRVGSVSATK